MKKTLVLLLLILIGFDGFGQNNIPKTEVGFNVGFWESKYNGGDENLFKQAGEFTNYPFTLLKPNETSRPAKDDFSFSLPSFRFFVRRNYEDFYLSTGISFIQDNIGYRVPARAKNPDVLYHYARVRTNSIEIPVYIGHRLDFFNYLRVFGGLVPTFSINSAPSLASIFESGFSETENRNGTQAIQEIQDKLVDSFRPFYLSGSVGIGFDYKIISIEAQLDRTLISLSENGTSIGNDEVVLDERRTREILWIGLKIPLNK
jgi:hypothetical protein